MDSRTGKNNRRKGAQFERDVVNVAKSYGLNAYRAGHGQTSPEFPDADVIIMGQGYECKKRKQTPDWIYTRKRIPKRMPYYLARWLDRGPCIVCRHGKTVGDARLLIDAKAFDGSKVPPDVTWELISFDDGGIVTCDLCVYLGAMNG